MKKFLLIAALSAACFSASAQNKGDMAVGGVIGISGGSSTTTVNLNGNSTSTNSPSSTMFEFSPEFSYFIIDRLELSAGLNYGMQRDLNSTTGDGTNLYSTTNIAMFTIGGNYYLPIFGDYFYYTPGLKLGFGGGSVTTQNSANSKTTTKVPFAFGLDLELGTVEFRPVDFLGISLNLFNLSVAYNTINTGAESVKLSTSTFGVGLNYGMSAGVKYYF